MTDQTTQSPAIAGKSNNPAGVLKRSSSYFIDPTKIIRTEGFNPRFDFGAINELAQSIKANGLLNAIRVKRLAQVDGNGALFALIDGDRRLTAIEQLIKKGHTFPEGIPAIIVDKAQDDVTSLIQMFEANSGKTFLPLEEAAAYKRMQDAGMTLKQICAAVGRAHMHVAEILNILKADDSVKDAVKDGSIGKTMAKQISKIAKGDTEKQKQLVEDAKKAKNAPARRALLKDLDNTRVTKAASKGKVLKIRSLSNHELSEIGTVIAEQLVAAMEFAGIKPDADIRAQLATEDDSAQLDLATAYYFGALQALKVAAGATNDLVLP